MLAALGPRDSQIEAYSLALLSRDLTSAKGSEPPFAIVQGIVLVLLVVLGISGQTLQGRRSRRSCKRMIADSTSLRASQ